MPPKTSKKDTESAGKNIWAPPRWPWELELLTFLLVLGALLLPLVLLPDTTTDLTAVPATASAGEGMVSILWVFAIIGTYFAHISLANTRVDYNTTPANNQFAPLFFGALCYGHLFYAARSKDAFLPAVSGDPWQMVGYAFLVLGLALLLARLRVLRYRARFRKVTWNLETKPTFDRSFFFDLGRAILPVFYLPKRYRFSDEGILIEGFHYLLAIPFRSVEAVEPMVQFSPLTTATYYAGSSSNLMIIQVNDHPDPIVISPRNIDGALKFCEDKASEHLVVSRRKTKAPAGAGTTRRIEAADFDT